MNLGKVLKDLRAEKRELQKNITTAIGISGVTLSHIENELHQPTAKTLEKLCEFYKVSVNYIYLRAIQGENSYDRKTMFLLRAMAAEASKQNDYE